MLAEFVSKLEQLFRQSQGADLLALQPDPRRHLFTIGGVLQEREIPPPLRTPNMIALEDLIHMLEDSSAAPSPEVYHNEGFIAAHLDRLDRRERVQLKLERTERFTTLAALHLGLKLSSKDAVKFLRFRMPDAPPQVLDALRKIDFTRSSAGRTHVEHGKESLGRSVEAAVQQADRVPDRFIVRVPVYSNPGVRGFWAEIEVGLYLDLDDEVIELRTSSDDIETALQQAQGRIHELLLGALPGVPVYYGFP
jgi:hypothetical protein